jgi:hypothetical protein
MAFVQVFPTPHLPDVAGALKVERTTFTALNSDAAGTATVRFLRRIDGVRITGDVKTITVNNAVQPPTVAFTFPGGTATPTTGTMQLEGV